MPVREGAFRRGHRVGNRALTAAICGIFTSRFSDILSGYKVMSRRFVKSFPALASGFETETELVVHALELRMQVAEVEVSYRERPRDSTSKLSTARDGVRIFRTILSLVREERPLLTFTLASATLALPLCCPPSSSVSPFLALAPLWKWAMYTFLGRKAKASDLWLVSEAAYETKLWAAAIVFALCLGACVAAVLASGRNPALSLAGAAGLAVICYNLLVGCVQFADNRYSYAILPVVLLALCVCAATIIDAVHARRRERLLHRMSSARPAN